MGRRGPPCHNVILWPATSGLRSCLHDNVLCACRAGAAALAIGPVKYGVTEVDKTKFLPKSRWAREEPRILEDAPTIDGFLTKNRDKVPDSLVAYLRGKSQNAFFGLVFNQQDGVGGGDGAKTTVSKFNNEIEAFFKVLLDGAEPKFIRGINPTPKATSPADTMGE